MTAPRAKFLLAAAASTLPLATPVSAQVPDSVVINIMRECAKIDDPTARLACYDNNIRQAGSGARASVPGQTQVPQGSGAVVASTGIQGFGSENVRQPERIETPSSQVQEISPRVSAIRPREPGVYLLTMEDDTQWLFAEGVSSSYRMPKIGSTIEIERGSLGSYLMRFEGQAAVPVRRVR